MTKKTKKLAILLVALMTSGSMFFASCNDDEQLTNKEISMQSKMENFISDGWHYGYLGVEDGQVVEIKELIIEGKIVEIYINGKKGNVKTTYQQLFPAEIHKHDKNTWEEANMAALDKALEFGEGLHKEGIPCVSVIDLGTDGPNDYGHTYQVLFEDQVPCSWEKYR